MSSPSELDAEPGATRARLGVVVPLANEQATCTEFLGRVVAQLGEGDTIFCVVDNASRDNTRDLVDAFAANDSRVRLVWAPENRCVVDAYFRGYREALADGCEWILEMDGGLSHLPEEIPRFLAAMATGVDFAAGSRFVRGSRMESRWTRYILSRGGTVLATLMLGTRMRDMTSGFECFTRAALESVVERGVRSRAHFFQTEIRTWMHAWRWVEVPITYAAPSNSVGTASITESLRELWRLRRDGGVPEPVAADE